jgi:hypothetical protein
VRIAAFALLSSASTFASATPLSEAVDIAAFELCPAFLTGELSVNDAGAMKKHGFVRLTPEAGRDSHPRFGKLQMIMKKISDGELVISSGENAFCQVQWQGTDAPAILATLKSELLTEQGYAVDPTNQGNRNGTYFETFKRQLEPGIVSYFQLLSMPQPSGRPRFIAQISVVEEQP